MATVAELVTLFAALEAQLEAEIARSLPPGNERESRQPNSFDQLIDGPWSPTSIATFFAELSEADCIILGDYHPLPETKIVVVKIVEELLSRNKQPTLALDCLPSGAPPPRDTADEGFRESVDTGQWPFGLAAWSPLFDFARDMAVNICGIGDRSGISARAGLERAQSWSEALSSPFEEGTGPHIIVIGEANIAPNHLGPLLQKRYGVSTVKTVLLAPPRLYWRALTQVDEPCRWAYDSNGVMAILPVHPIRRVNSYRAWLYDDRELTVSPDSMWCPRYPSAATTAVAVRKLLQEIATFFDALDTNIEQPRVLMPQHLRELSLFIEELPLAEAADLLHHIERNQSYCALNENAVYLADLTRAHIGEELTHALHVNVSPPPRNDESRRGLLMRHTIREAIGYLGSKLVAPERQCLLVDAFRHMLHDGDEEEQKLARYVIDLADQGSFPREHDCLAVTIDELNAMAHAVGYAIGEGLWRAFRRGEIGRPLLVHLFRHPVTPSTAAEKLFERLRSYLSD